MSQQGQKNASTLLLHKNLNELKVFHALKKKINLYNSKSLNQGKDFLFYQTTIAPYHI